ncbi:hypothetical protein ACN4EG_04715 [Alkalinema pantanalense CENA528]|uniref:hypothetical protein n=1 Tax=Alkalinema pantanalense TaxID=1620705 RepID=UPI003D6FEEEC
MAGIVGCAVFVSTPAKADNALTEGQQPAPSSQLESELSRQPSQASTDNRASQKPLSSERSETPVEVAQVEVQNPSTAKPASIRTPMMSRIFPCPSMMQ